MTRRSVERGEVSLFVLRRAWWTGVCRKRDVERAFGLSHSPATVARLMKAAVLDFPGCLKWVKRLGVYPVSSAMRPREVSPEVMFDLLAGGATPRMTGLFEEDIVPVFRPTVRFGLAATEQASALLLEAAIRQQPIRILYVGMRRNEQPRWRRVIPRALVFTGMYWQMSAQDVDDDAKGYPIKSFVVYRILDAREDSSPLPSGFVHRKLVKPNRQIKVFLSDELNEHQADAVRRGLGLKADGTLLWPEHLLHDFKREWAGVPPAPDIVWPPLSRVEEMD